jgi:hypothetical protein
MYGLAGELGGPLHLMLRRKALCGAEPVDRAVWPTVMRGIVTLDYARRSDRACRDCLARAEAKWTLHG